MGNPFHSEVSKNEAKKGTHKEAKHPSGKSKPGDPSFKQHPKHDAPGPECQTP